MNIECDKEALDELENAFRFNDAVIRSLVMRRKKADTEPSPLVKSKEDGDGRSDSAGEERGRAADESLVSSESLG